jgi:hypothetical protein
MDIERYQGANGHFSGLPAFFSFRHEKASPAVKPGLLSLSRIIE